MRYQRVDSTILREKIHLSLSEVLSENSAVFIKNYGRGALATASFRGTAASHTGVIWNGMSITSPMAGMVDFSLIPVYIIDELTLNHGPSSLVYKGGGLGGSINLENVPEWNTGFGAEFLQGVGSYSTFDEYLKVDAGNRKLKSSTRIYHNYSKNDFTFVNTAIGNLDPVTGNVTHPIDTNQNAEILRYGLLQELYYRPVENHLLSVVYWGQYADRTLPAPSSYEGPANANLNNQTDTDHRVVVSWKHYGSRSRLLLRSGYAHKELEYLQLNRIPGLGEVPSVYSVSRQNSIYQTASYTWDPSDGLTLEGKMDLNVHGVESVDTVSGAGYHRFRNELSLLGRVSKSFGTRLNLNLIVRQEWVEGERLPVMPYLGADLKITDRPGIFLRANISRNSRYPSVNELYWVPGGNPGLLSEEGISMETGLELKETFGSHALKAGLTVYRTDVRNWILWLPSTWGYWEPFNLQRVLSRGLETEIMYRWQPGDFDFRLSGNYAYTRSENLGESSVLGDDSFGKQLVYIPVHSGNMMLRAGWRMVYVVYQYNAYSERFTTSSNDPTRRDWLYPYFMNDLSLGAVFHTGISELSAGFKIYNLFNESYYSVLYRPMPGRNFHIVIGVRF